MNQIQDQQFISHIKQQLDSQMLDSDTRLALQKARAAALAKSAKSWRQLPWLPYAVTASLLTVVVFNLPSETQHPLPVQKPETVKVIQPSSITPTMPIAVVLEKPTAHNSMAAKPSVDADLLENLELYEDAEFYQWLSEQDIEGATDA